MSNTLRVSMSGNKGSYAAAVLVLFLIGLGLIYAGYSQNKTTTILQQRGQNTTGKVVTLIAHYNPRQTNQTTVSANPDTVTIQYTYTDQNGSNHQNGGNHSYSFYAPHPQIGDEITVTYDPQHPSTSQVAGDMHTSLLLYLIGAAVIVLAIVTRKGNPPRAV